MLAAAVDRNPALLKLDLYCRGLRVDGSCLVEEDGGRRILRTRAGLGSGLELILPGGLWTNVPVAEPFARQSPYVLRRRAGAGAGAGGYLLERDGRPVAPVRLSPRPDWYDAATSSGKPMTRIGTLQGTYLGIYQAKVCEYWTARPKINCKFCSVGLNLGVDEAGEKTIEEVLEVVRAARDESGITYVDFNTGHYEGDTYLDLLEPYIARIKAELGLLVGVQTPPHRDLSRYDRLREMGVNRVSFCFEVFDRRIFRELCPGKDAEYGLDHYLEAIRYCAHLGSRGPRHEPWVTNGEIIAGLEPPASSIAAIDWITSVGAIPTVCVFRPLTGTDLERLPPPRTEDLVPVFRRLYEASMERGLPIGCAPNVHVSLVLLPEECASLSERRFPWQRARLSALRLAFGHAFRRRLERLDARRRRRPRPRPRAEARPARPIPWRRHRRSARTDGAHPAARSRTTPAGDVASAQPRVR
jgi:uncharacterized radical SAM superfamily protein